MRPRNFRCDFLHRSGRRKYGICEGIFRCGRSASVKDLQHVAPTSKLSFLYQNLRNQKKEQNSARMDSQKPSYADVLKNSSTYLNSSLPVRLIPKAPRTRLRADPRGELPFFACGFFANFCKSTLFCAHFCASERA